MKNALKIIVSVVLLALFTPSFTEVKKLPFKDFSKKYSAELLYGKKSELKTIVQPFYKNTIQRFTWETADVDLLTEWENTADDNELFSLIVVKNKQTNKEVITQIVNIDLEMEEPENKEIKSNVFQPPYGEQSLIIADDFNFDGQLDLAIKDGAYSCYGGPSFQIYLNTGSSLKYHQKLSDLAHEYCGLFTADKKTQTIYTMTKSGAAYHQYDDYKIIDNQPVLVLSVAEEPGKNGRLWKYTENRLVNGKMQERQYQKLVNDIGELNIYLQMVLKNGKKMILATFKDTPNRLFYLFTDKDDHVELYYNDDLEFEGIEFAYDYQRNLLIFKTVRTVYIISKNGIDVKLPNKAVITLKAGKIIQGKIENILNANLANVSAMSAFLSFELEKNKKLTPFIKYLSFATKKGQEDRLYVCEDYAMYPSTVQECEIVGKIDEFIYYKNEQKITFGNNYREQIDRDYSKNFNAKREAVLRKVRKIHLGKITDMSKHSFRNLNIK